MQRTDPLEISDLLEHCIALSDMGEQIPQATRERMERAIREMRAPITAEELAAFCRCAGDIVSLAANQKSQVQSQKAGEN